MSAYYNEHDPFAAAWLRELIAADLIAPGEVDERDIQDVRPDELRPFRQCHFFAGIGVWSYALRRADWPDEQSIWTGSCPCQPFSAAGKGGGFDDERHLWPAWHWLIEQCRPDIIIGEQVADGGGLLWAELLQADLDGSGYACGITNTCAAGFGAAFIGQRLYWLAEAEGARGRWRSQMAQRRRQKPGGPSEAFRRQPRVDGRGSRSSLSVADVLSPSYGLAGRVGRLRGYGNGLHADQAEGFVEAVMDTLAIADTHPQGEDAEQASSLMSGGGAAGNRHRDAA